MKRSLGILLLAVLSALLLTLAGCNLLSASSENEETQVFTVIYLDDDGSELTRREVAKGECAPELIPADKVGYVFDYWTKNGKEFRFSYKVTSELTLVAHRTPKLYTITYMDGDTRYAQRRYSIETPDVPEPAPPERYGYTCAWEAYELTMNDITVNAVYTPVPFSVSFYADNQLTAVRQYTLNDRAVSEPAVPSKPGYAGTWENYELTGEDIRVRAVYTPITYYASFYADGNLVATLPFNAENMTVTPPDIPQREGYSAVWESYVLSFDDIGISAEYTAMEHRITFIAEGTVVAEIPYNVETKEIAAPEVPPKDGYTGTWENYELTGEDIRVRAVYTPITYYASFYADGNLVATLPFNAENMTVTPPDIPQKEGYSAVWESYVLSFEDINIVVKYTPTEYYVTFIADGNIVAKIPYTVENPEISLPDVPFKEGYDGAWESFIPDGDTAVQAVYTKLVSPDPAPTEGLLYERSGDGYVVTGISTPQSKVVIPSTFDGSPVVAVSSKAFLNDSTMEELYLCDGILEISAYAFYNCARLKTVRLSETLQTIGESAFDSCSFTQIAVPNSVREVKTYAFCHCQKLESVSFGIGLITIERLAFYDCPALAEITFADPSGWYSSADSAATQGEDLSATFADPSAAAKYITENFKLYCKKSAV